LICVVSSLIVALIGVSVATIAPAQAVTGGASLSAQAGLTASGAGLTLQLTVTCPKGTSFTAIGTVTQRVSSTASATGTGDAASKACSGAAQTQRIGVPASPREGSAAARPFIVSSAFVTVSVGFCDQQSCVTRKLARSVSVVALTLNQSTYSSPDFTISLPSTGTVEAQGAGAIIRVPYRCAPNTAGLFSATLSERTGAYVYTGVDSAEVTCNSATQTGVLAFHADGAFWHAGPVFVRVLLDSFCGPPFCGAATIAFRTLTLGRPA
jgi:hypothetical protein